jgi:molybdopterin-guanine dinucleotide biosynthesis protein A
MPPERITGLILAGGLGRRMGGRDKGLQPFRGRPMAAWAIERLAPQVDALLINANQNLEAYAAFGHPVVPDRIAGFAGPLAGLHTGLLACETPLLVTAPCDSPFLPEDLVDKLRAALEAAGADLAVAKTGDQPHPVFSLVRREVLDGLTAFLESGGRKVDAWYAALKTVEVAFADERAFANINTLEELNLLES